MVLLLVFMQLTRDLFAIAKFLFIIILCVCVCVCVHALQHQLESTHRVRTNAVLLLTPAVTLTFDRDISIINYEKLLNK